MIDERPQPTSVRTKLSAATVDAKTLAAQLRLFKKKPHSCSSKSADCISPSIGQVNGSMAFQT